MEVTQSRQELKSAARSILHHQSGHKCVAQVIWHLTSGPDTITLSYGQFKGFFFNFVLRNYYTKEKYC